MADRHYILGTAGHIDHGKSSLIEALTGTDPDRLPEEKERGMTIELGFAQLSLPTSDESVDTLALGVIDVPGHADFVKNMVAGVGAIDLALFIVAADDGWMPQTEEHYQILTYLGVKRAIVALTKVDLVDDLELVLEDVKENLMGGLWEEIDVIPVSSHTGTGIEDLRDRVSQILTESGPVRDKGKPRLPVDRAFSLKGVGTVVAGSLTEGRINVGDDLEVMPQGAEAHVRTAQSHGSAAESVPEVMFHHGSMGVPARIHFLGQRTLSPGETVLAELRFHEPIYVFVGDGFVIRDASLGLTLAGGIVLDEDANRRAFRKPFQAEFLEARRETPNDLDVLVSSQLRRDKVAFIPKLLAKSAFSAEEILQSVEKAVEAGGFSRNGDWVFFSEWWKGIAGLASDSILEVHKEHPDQLGLPLRDLRSMIEPELPAPKFFDMVLEGLMAGEFTKAGPNIRHRDHIPTLPPQLLKAGELVRKRLASDPVSPPNKGETATNPDEEKALRFLEHTGEVIVLDPTTVISQAGFDRLKSEIVEYLKAQGVATASELRQNTGTVRRILMPLLEMMDEEEVTLREGDERRLKG